MIICVIARLSEARFGRSIHGLLCVLMLLPAACLGVPGQDVPRGLVLLEADEPWLVVARSELREGEARDADPLEALAFVGRRVDETGALGSPVPFAVHPRTWPPVVGAATGLPSGEVLCLSARRRTFVCVVRTAVGRPGEGEAHAAEAPALIDAAWLAGPANAEATRSDWPGMAEVDLLATPDSVLLAGGVPSGQAGSGLFVARAEPDPILGPWSFVRISEKGRRPSLARTHHGGVALAYVEPETRSVPRPWGPILLTTSPDGVEWSEPMPTVDEEKAHSSALAFDEELGLVLVYTAERENGWPVFAARSQDFGQTWGEPVMLTDPGIRCLRPDALIHDGTLYVAYLTVPKDPPEGRGPRALANPDGAFVLTMDPAELP